MKGAFAAVLLFSAAACFAGPIFGTGGYFFKVAEPENAVGVVPFVFAGYDTASWAGAINVGFTDVTGNEQAWITSINADLFAYGVTKFPLFPGAALTLGLELGGQCNWNIAEEGMRAVFWPYLGGRGGFLYNADPVWFAFHLRFVPYLGLIPEIAVGVGL